MAKSVYQIMKEKGEELLMFKSPLAAAWQTLVFKVIDTMHNMEQEGYETGDIKRLLLPMVEQYDKQALEEAIEKLKTLKSKSDDKVILTLINDSLEMLEAVYVSLK